MASEHEKGEIELELFRCFLRLAKLPIEPHSVEKRLPPEPDILCRHRLDGPVAFELVELCDRKIAKSIAQASEVYLRTSDPSAAVISRKLRSNYETSAPIELLCYSGRIVTPDNVIIQTITPYFRSRRHVFRKAWFLGRKGLHVVWDVTGRGDR